MAARAEWEAIAARIAPYQADAIEENVADQGLAPESDEFFAACVAEAQAEDLAL